MYGALAHIVLKNHRNQVDANSERPGDESDVEGGRLRRSDTNENGKDDRREREGDRLLANILVEHKKLEVVKDRMIERLVLEQAMEEGFIRCVLFFVGFISFIMMVYTAYPADELLPVHEAIRATYGLDDMAENIATLADISEGLGQMGINSRYFSPGSADYTADSLGRAYLPEPMVTPPSTRIATNNQPQLTKAFTIAVWLKTSVRYGSVIRKALGSKTCYDFGVESIQYGQHETTGLKTVINPAAEFIYYPMVDQQTVWKQSRVKSQMQDSKWHHLAIIVNETHAIFAHDAILEEAKTLPRQITDCQGGDVFVGSDLSAGELVSFRWFPRALSMSELSDTKSAGKPLDDLLSSAGASAQVPSEVEQLATSLADKKATDDAQFDGLKHHVGDKMRRLSQFMKDAIVVSTSKINEPADPTPPYRRLSSSHAQDGIPDEDVFSDAILRSRSVSSQAAGFDSSNKGKGLSNFENISSVAGRNIDALRRLELTQPPEDDRDATAIVDVYTQSRRKDSDVFRTLLDEHPHLKTDARKLLPNFNTEMDATSELEDGFSSGVCFRRRDYMCVHDAAARELGDVIQQKSYLQRTEGRKEAQRKLVQGLKDRVARLRERGILKSNVHPDFRNLRSHQVSSVAHQGSSVAHPVSSVAHQESSVAYRNNNDLQPQTTMLLSSKSTDVSGSEKAVFEQLRSLNVPPPGLDPPEDSGNATNSTNSTNSTNNQGGGGGPPPDTTNAPPGNNNGGNNATANDTQNGDGGLDQGGDGGLDQGDDGLDQGGDDGLNQGGDDGLDQGGDDGLDQGGDDGLDQGGDDGLDQGGDDGLDQGGDDGLDQGGGDGLDQGGDDGLYQGGDDGLDQGGDDGLDQGGDDGFDQGGDGGLDQGGPPGPGQDGGSDGFDQGGFDQGGYEGGEEGFDQGGYEGGEGFDQGGYEGGEGFDQGGYEGGEGFDQGGYEGGFDDHGGYDDGPPMPGGKGKEENNMPDAEVQGKVVFNPGMDVYEEDLHPDSPLAEAVCKAAVAGLAAGADSSELWCWVEHMWVAGAESPDDDNHDRPVRKLKHGEEEKQNKHEDEKSSGDNRILTLVTGSIEAEYTVSIPGNMMDTVRDQVGDPEVFKQGFEQSFVSELTTLNGGVPPNLVVEDLQNRQAVQEKAVEVIDFDSFTANLNFADNQYCTNVNMTWCVDTINTGMVASLPTAFESSLNSLEGLIDAGVKEADYLPFCSDYLSVFNMKNPSECLDIVQNVFAPIAKCYIQRKVRLLPGDPNKLDMWILYRSDSQNDMNPSPLSPNDKNCVKDKVTESVNNGKLDASFGTPQMMTWIGSFFDKFLTSTFRKTEASLCISESEVLSGCARWCSNCGVEYSPISSQVLDAVEECSDAASFEDWNGNSCVWYFVNDVVTTAQGKSYCTMYADDTVRANCPMTCQLCDKVSTMINVFDIVRDQKTEPNELNALFVATNLNAYRLSYHDASRPVGVLCCYALFPKKFADSSGACQGMMNQWFDEQVGMLLLYNYNVNPPTGELKRLNTAKKWADNGFDARTRELSGMPELQYWPTGAYDSVLPDIFGGSLYRSCILQNVNGFTQEEILEGNLDYFGAFPASKMNPTIITNPNSPLYLSFNAALSVFTAGISKRMPLLKYTNADAERVESFPVTQLNSAVTQLTLEMPWLSYAACTTHTNCTSLFPYVCQRKIDSNDPFALKKPSYGGGAAQCDDYSKTTRQPMYCASKCLTGGCGDYAEIFWGTTAPPGSGFCQPCNGCTATDTFNGGACPGHCLTGLPATVTLGDGEFEVIQDPNAMGGFTIDTWVKGFDYQYILKKTVKTSGSHPNHRWQGYQTGQIQVKNVDKYFQSAACKVYDGLYETADAVFDWSSAALGQQLIHTVNKHVIELVIDALTGSSMWVLVATQDESSPVYAKMVDNGGCQGSIGKQILIPYTEAVVAWFHSSSAGLYSNGLGKDSVVTMWPSKSYSNDMQVLPYTGELACYWLDYNSFCFRQKWHEESMRCISNPFSSNLFSNSDWHNYVVVKRASLKAQKAIATGELHNVERVDTLEIYVDGKVEMVLEGLDGGTNLVPKWGAIDCAGQQISQSIVSSTLLDHFAGFPYNNIKYDNTWVVNQTATDMTVKAYRMGLQTMFPVDGLMPLGGNMTMTSFTFPNMNVPKNAFVHDVRVTLCASDLLANYRYDLLSCPSTNLYTPPDTITLEIFGVPATVTELNDWLKQTDSCYLHNLPRTTNKVEWVVNALEWRNRAVFHQHNFAKSEHFPSRRTYDESCEHISVNLKPVVDEILQDSSWQQGRSITILIAEKGQYDTPCVTSELATPLMNDTEIVNAIKLAAGSPCATIETIKNKMNMQYPLWTVPYEDQANSEASLAQLAVAWCLNEQCTSPHFYGTGPDAKMGGSSITSAAGSDPNAVALTQQKTEKDAWNKIYGPGGTYAQAQTSLSASPIVPAPPSRALSKGKNINEGHPELLQPSFSVEHQEYSKDHKWKPHSETERTPAVFVSQEELHTLHTGMKNHGHVWPPVAAVVGTKRRMVGQFRGRIASSDPKDWSQQQIGTAVVSADGEIVRSSSEEIMERSLESSTREFERHQMTLDPTQVIDLNKLESKVIDTAIYDGPVAPTVRYLQANPSNMGLVTVGDLQLSGLPRTGMLYGMKFVNRAMKTSEVQQNYYSGADVVNTLAGPVDTILATEDYEDAKLEIVQFPQEVVSIIPPVVLQSRVPYAKCSDQVPGLATNLLNYFEQQVKRKCDISYNCDFPQEGIQSGFGCIDRDAENIQSPTKYFDRESVIVPGLMVEGHVYPEFLDTLTIPTVYKDGKMMPTSDYVDMQTKEMVILNVFVNTKLRSGTILQVGFAYSGPGKVEVKYTLNSYKQMDETIQEEWLFYVYMVLSTAVLDLALLVVGVIQINQERMAWRRNIERDGAIKLDTPGRASVWSRVKRGLSEQLPLFNVWDYFDVGLRIAIIFFTSQHYGHYYSDTFDSTGNGKFEEKVNEILKVPWGSETQSFESKVELFSDKLQDFLAILDQDVTIRVLAYLLILLSFFRLIAYLRVHPRIAVLYKTIELAIDDLAHFFMVFGLLYFTLAFVGMWMFGANKGEFQSIVSGLVTQFQMIIGEFPFPEADTEQSYGLFMSYLVLYALIMFFILMNFLLAIIVDSYAKVKEEVKECVIECTIFLDIMSLFTYPVLRIVQGWPGRSSLIRTLLALDVNFDFINDEEEAPDSVLITQEALVKGKVFPSDDKANNFLRYYIWLCPEIDANKEEEPGSLEHQRKFHALRNLDVLRERLLEAAIDAHLLDIQRGVKPKETLPKQLEALKAHFEKVLHSMHKEATMQEHEVKQARQTLLKAVGPDRSWVKSTGGHDIMPNGEPPTDLYGGLGGGDLSAAQMLGGTASRGYSGDKAAAFKQALAKAPPPQGASSAQLGVSETDAKKAAQNIFGAMFEQPGAAPQTAPALVGGPGAQSSANLAMSTAGKPNLTVMTPGQGAAAPDTVAVDIKNPVDSNNSMGLVSI